MVWSDILPYAAVLVATIVEGEAVFVGACVLVGMGRLHPAGVFLAAAVGGSLGDQFYFYGLRGRLRSWLNRFRPFQQRKEHVAAFVAENSTQMILACRFLPGLRILIPAACAYAGVSPLKFSGLNFLGSLAWAGAILLVVSKLGPQALAQLGITSWWAALIPAVCILGTFQWFRLRLQKRGRALETLKGSEVSAKG